MAATGNVLGFVPSRWRDCIGNGKIIKTYQGLVKQVRIQGKRKATQLFVYGPSRTGKTATTKLFAQAMLCRNLDPETLDPCGNCQPCLTDAAQYGERGLGVYLAQDKVHYLSIDATKVGSVKELKDQLAELRSYEGARIVVIDEVHRLQHRDMDEQLLKPVEEKNFIWIMSSAYTDKLEPMFLNRFVKLSTQLPDEVELAGWLYRRRQEEGIRAEDEALLRLAEKAASVPGAALQAVEFASLDRETGLTLYLVEDFDFQIEG